MTRRPAKIVCIVGENPTTIILKVQTHDGMLIEYSITRDQLFNINADSANILAGRQDEN